MTVPSSVELVTVPCSCPVARRGYPGDFPLFPLIGYRVTIAINGVTTIDGQLIDGITGGALNSNERDPGPIMLQGDHGTVSYRNIVLTPAL